MNLLEKEKEMYRSRALQRVGSVLVCISFLLALAFPPQPVKAVVVADDAMIAAVVAAFLSSCGLTFSASGMDSSGVKNQIGVMIDQYLGEVFDGQSPIQWLGEFTLGYGHGKIVLPAGVANKLSAFADWMVGEFNLSTSSSTPIYSVSGYGKALANGGAVIFGSDSRSGLQSVGSWLTVESFPLVFADGKTVTCQFVPDGESSTRYFLYFDGVRGSQAFYIGKFGSYNIDSQFCFAFNSDFKQLEIATFQNGKLEFTSGQLNGTKATDFLADGAQIDESFSIGPADSISIPDTIPDTQEVTISTGAASDLTLDQALEQILAAIAEGQLSATREIVDAGTATDDPAQTITDVDELGLPALAETLTTRFPFSIPWDVAKAVKLLAAPAKTPRFEVDFMAPIAYRFGGQLGNTKVVLDFSDYEIIGRISRWTSTIGFCLFLASGTKKLIWTA